MGDFPSPNVYQSVSFSRKVDRSRSPSMSRLYRRPSLVRSPLRTLESPKLTPTEIDELTSPLLPYSTTYTSAYRSSASDQYQIPNMTSHELDSSQAAIIRLHRDDRIHFIRKIWWFICWCWATVSSWIRSLFGIFNRGRSHFIIWIKDVYHHPSSLFLGPLDVFWNIFNMLVSQPLIWLYQTVRSFAAPIPSPNEMEEMRRHRGSLLGDPNITPEKIENEDDNIKTNYRFIRTSSSRRRGYGSSPGVSRINKASRKLEMDTVRNTGGIQTTPTKRPDFEELLDSNEDSVKSSAGNTPVGRSRTRSTSSRSYYTNTPAAEVSSMSSDDGEVSIIQSGTVREKKTVSHLSTHYDSEHSLSEMRLRDLTTRESGNREEIRRNRSTRAGRDSKRQFNVSSPRTNVNFDREVCTDVRSYSWFKEIAINIVRCIFFVCIAPIFYTLRGTYFVCNGLDLTGNVNSSLLIVFILLCLLWLIIPFLLLVLIALSGRSNVVLDQANKIVPVAENTYKSIVDLSYTAADYTHRMKEASTSVMYSFFTDTFSQLKTVYNYGLWYRITGFFCDTLMSVWDFIRTVGNVFAMILYGITCWVVETVATIRFPTLPSWGSTPEVVYIHSPKYEDSAGTSPPCPTCCGQQASAPVIVQNSISAPSTADIDAKIQAGIANGIEAQVQKLVNLQIAKLESQVKTQQAEFAAGSAVLKEKYQTDIKTLYDLIENLKIQLTTEMKTSGAVVDMAYLDSMIRTAIKTYDADKTGLPDYALESAGGSVISTRCSETHGLSTRLEKIFNIPLFYSYYGPRTVIQRNAPALVPGECWAVTGGVAYLTIRLARAIEVTSVSYEHIPAQLSPEGDIRSAPKEFTIYAYEDESDIKTRVKLGDFVYDNTTDPLQSFPIKVKAPYPVQIIELQVDSNHGAVYTCLYRFRVHGTPVIFQDTHKPHDEL